MDWIRCNKKDLEFILQELESLRQVVPALEEELRKAKFMVAEERKRVEALTEEVYHLRKAVGDHDVEEHEKNNSSGGHPRVPSRIRLLSKVG